MINTNTRSNQVKDILIQYISQKRLVQGSQLPSEADMAKRLGVSRNTIREAYIALEAEGFIIRRHGIGTFVARTPMINDFQNGFSSFPQRIEAAGYTPSCRNLSTSSVFAPSQIYDALDAPASEKLLYVKRVIFANEIPAVYINDYFAPTIKERDFDWDAFRGDMIEFIATSLGVNGSQMHSKIQAIATTEDIASHLQLPVDTPIINVRTTVYTLDSQPIVHTLSYLNPNIVELDITRIIRSK